MKKAYLSILFAAAVAIVMTGCATHVVPGATTTKDGMIVFSAEGQSIAETQNPTSVAKAQLAASTIAKANLLEEIKGALLSNKVKVDGLMLTEQTATKTVSGWMARSVVEISSLREIVTEETNLMTEPPVEPKEQIITAIATLTLSKADLKDMKQFVE